MARMLYYPTVTPPREIIQQAVLYWDRLILICPKDYEFLVDQNPELAFLRTRGFVQLIDPLELGIPDFKHDMFDRVVKTERWAHSTENRDQWLPVADDVAPEVGYSWPDWQRQHLLRGKFGGPVERALIKSKLAIPLSEHSDVLVVSSRVQAALMSVAARTIASHLALSDGAPSRGFRTWHSSRRPVEISRTQARLRLMRRWERGLFDRMVIPQTDQATAHVLAHLWEAPDFQRFSAWAVDIGAMLPVAPAEVPIDTLLAFRRSHDRELRNFIRTLNSFLLELQASAIDPRLVLAAFRRRLENAIGSVESVAHRRRIAITRTSATATVAAGASYLAMRPEMQGVGWILGLVTGIAVNVASTKMTQPYGEDAVAFEYAIRAGIELGSQSAALREEGP